MIIPVYLKNFLRKIKENFVRHIWKLEFKRKLSASVNKPRIFYLMGLGDKFPNLGDQAQAAAIPFWFKKHFNMPVIEIKNYQIETCLPILKCNIKTEDVVFLHSGGNFGDDWYNTQLLREIIISSLGDNKIVQLPQTIFFSDSENGILRKIQCQNVINSHANCQIFGRDYHSAEIARKLFNPDKVVARPDMVLSLQEDVERVLGKEITRREEKLKKILLIMRNDKEGIFNIESKQDIAKILSDFGYEAQLWDTDVDDIFPDRRKFEKLTKYLEFISGFDAVITDRYHGLIFSVLVKRPCVVLRTHNHKLTSAFDWFNDVNFVKLVESTDDVLEALNNMQNLREYVSPRWNEIHFDPMAIEVKRFLFDAEFGEG